MIFTVNVLLYDLRLFYIICNCSLHFFLAFPILEVGMKNWEDDFLDGGKSLSKDFEGRQNDKLNKTNLTVGSIGRFTITKRADLGEFQALLFIALLKEFFQASVGPFYRQISRFGRVRDIGKMKNKA